MIWPVLGAIAGAAVSGSMAKDAAEDAYNRNVASSSYDKQWGLMLDQIAFERQAHFAQHGIRWKTEDAKRAGLHPLAVLGSAGASYSPTISMPSTPYSQPGPGMDLSGVGSAVGDYLNQMGQDTSRAQVATATPLERKMTDLQVQNLQLQNDKINSDVGLNNMQMQEIAARIHRLNSAQIGPPMPGVVGGQDASRVPVVGAVEVNPSQVTSASPRSSGVEAGRTPFAKDFNVGSGVTVRLPSKEAAEALEGLGFMQHIAGPVILGVQQARDWWNGPESGPPDPRMKWSPWKQSWEHDAPRRRDYPHKPQYQRYR